MTVIRNRSGEKIRTMADWGRLAGPAVPRQWNQRHRSFEFAYHWTSGTGTELLSTAFDGADDLKGFHPMRATALGQARYDDFGGPRIHDLVVHGTAPVGNVVVSVELKGEEPFGETVDEHNAAGFADRDSGPKTREPERLANLLASIYGARLEDRPELGDVRYQLVSATAGTLVQAAQAQAAVLLIHEFIALEPDPAKHDANAEDLKHFLKMTFDADMPDGREWLLGPFRVPGSDRIPGDRDLYVAKLTTDTIPPEQED